MNVRPEFLQHVRRKFKSSSFEFETALCGVAGLRVPVGELIGSHDYIYEEHSIATNPRQACE